MTRNKLRIFVGLVSMLVLAGSVSCNDSITPTTGSIDIGGLKPFVVETGLPLIGNAVAVCSVKDFNAAGDGETDDTTAFTDAIGYANSIGGGTVYIPAGKYLIKKSLQIPQSVYLLGDWNDPDKNPEKITEGTILYCAADRDNFMGKPFLSSGSGSGAIGLTIYYPENDYAAPVLYPATLGCLDTMNNSSGFSTFRYITLINPFYGVSAGPNGNECHIIEHIYMTPLSKGVYVNMSTDIGRIEDLHISAKYYEAFTPDMDKAKLRSALKQNGVTGLILQRSDWQHGKDITIEDVHTGIRFEINPLASTVSNSANSSFVNVSMSNVVYGIDCLYSRKASETFTGLNIATDGSAESACIILRKGFFASVFVTGGTLANTGGSCIVAQPDAMGSISVSDTVFNDYKNAAVSLDSSVMSVVRSRFEKKDEPAIELLAGNRGFTSDSCYFGGDRVEDNTESIVSAGSKPYEKNDAWNLTIDLPFIPLPLKNEIYLPDVTEDAAIDNTDAIQQSLDEAAAGGGGIVYIPGGKYLVSKTLIVPGGVELRGVSSGPHHTTSRGTFLLTTYGEDHPEKQAFITLEKGAGINGVSIWYPNQIFNNPKKYPYAISGNGQDIWIVNVNTANAWNAIDLASADTGGHYLAYNSGMAFSNVITLDGSSKRGYIYNCHYNPHFYGRTSGTGLQGGSDQNGVEPMMLALFGQMDNKLNGALIIGDAADEQIFDFFNYRQKVGLILKEGKEKKGFSGNILFLGLDACGKAMDFETTLPEDLSIIAMTTDGFTYGDISLGGDFAVHFINTCFSTWNADARKGIRISQGNVDFNTCFFRTSASAENATIMTSGGNVSVVNSVFNHVSVIRNSNKEFAIAWETAVRDFYAESGTMAIHNNIGIEHFGSQPPSGDNLVVVYEPGDE
ncbi:MAG: glycosyl hydrolase family 28-related protein [Saccharofermentanales bacterium]